MSSKDTEKKFVGQPIFKQLIDLLPKGKFDTLIKKNIGARWTGEVQDLINKATPGDFYYFYHIAYRCGCDPMVRYLSETLTFKIK